VDFQRILTRYGGERLLYRLLHTADGHRFVLKGAVLWTAWEGAERRPTRDVDLLGPGRGTPETMAATFRTACAATVESDGLSFDATSVTATAIREDQDYEGVRVHALARLGSARIPVQVDVGFGDAVTPDPVVAILPPLLDFPPVRMKMYPPETVVAEKFEAMTRRGFGNTRLKDFYDLWILSETRDFDGGALAQALRATFDRRGTPLPSDVPPIALTPDFGADLVKRAQWEAFLDRNELSDAPRDLGAVTDRLFAFLWPLVTDDDDRPAPRSRWLAGVAWDTIRS
jgi:Nucleotidyl transferase AbiEii toxin, Type IV TA system